MASRERRPIASNKKAYHDYFVEDKYEAGISLAGTEVKSIRQGGVNLKDAYCTVTNGELLVRGLRISPYEKGNIFNKDPLRTRRLLAHKKEILKYDQKLKEKGYTLVPLEVYFKEGKVKVNIGLCKGKKLYDKRETIAKKDVERETEREMKIRLR